MALEGFRPTLWSRNLIMNMDKAYVFKNVVNTDYEGEITGFGNVVKINEIGDITISNYTEGTDITIQTLTDAQKELVIDQKKKLYHFGISLDLIKSEEGKGGPITLLPGITFDGLGLAITKLGEEDKKKPDESK